MATRDAMMKLFYRLVADGSFTSCGRLKNGVASELGEHDANTVISDFPYVHPRIIKQAFAGWMERRYAERIQPMQPLMELSVEARPRKRL